MCLGRYIRKTAPMIYDALILGAGGAGLMAAATAGMGGAQVVVIDHAPKVGKKILISGGGRCNFTNTGCDASCFLSENPHFVKSALSRYTQWDFLSLVEAHGIAWHEKTLGQLFCDGSARQIVAMLMAECEKAGADVRVSTQIGEVSHSDGVFHAAGVKARHLVVATGGPSIPKMGATGVAYDIAQQFGINVITPRPALVPLTLGEDAAAFKGNSGLAVDTIASVADASFKEAALFTHRGLSGPSILQVSSYWRDGAPVWLNLLPDARAVLHKAKREMPRAHFKAALAEHLPKRLAYLLADTLGIAGQLANVPDKILDAAAEKITRLEFHPTGTEGYAKAEVTAGGIDTDALSSKTMETKSVPGLFFIGEAVDVTGWLGGYNFQWAWSSGVAAGQEIVKRAQKMA